MTARCIECQHFSGKNQPKEFTRLGLYRCTKDFPWVFYPIFSERECEKFIQVSPEDLPARLAFEERAKQ